MSSSPRTVYRIWVTINHLSKFLPEDFLSHQSAKIALAHYEWNNIPISADIVRLRLIGNEWDEWVTVEQTFPMERMATSITHDISDYCVYGILGKFGAAYILLPGQWSTSAEAIAASKNIGKEDESIVPDSTYIIKMILNTTLKDFNIVAHILP